MREAILTAPVNQVLYQLTKPMVIGIMAVFFFQLVDTYFISLLGTTSLAAVGFAMPVTMLVMNLSIGLGIAASALIAKSFGAGDDLQAKRAAMAALMLSVVLGVLISILGLLVNDYIFAVLGASPDLLPEIWNFMVFWWPGSVVMLVMMVQNSSMRATGNTRLPSQMMLVAAVLNALLDPLLIFGWGPVPALGVGGAALASTLCWVIVLAVILTRQRQSGFLSRHGMSWSQIQQLWRRMMALGIPAMVTNMMVPVAGAVLLVMVAPLGEEAVAGFGVGMRLEPFALIVILALTSTLPTFVAQNHGAHQDERIFEALLSSFKFLLLLQGAIVITFWLTAEWLATLFSDDLAVQETIIEFVRWLPIGYFGMGVVLCVNSALNSLQKTSSSMVLNAVRLFVFYVPGAFVGSYLWDYSGLLIGAALGNLIIGLLVWRMTCLVAISRKLTIGGWRFSFDDIKR
ncbi:MATE family efflux transporter [Bacterioplanoides sp. SCSIO 12839]|uniref:MATE family efflux transporter n=1 Tax=Bacterioplanoides sp. SCSIO 12839 TaxID=2829569 RepID=UPI002102D7F6|nr:MATE family efflux transporter [Bacterioplanoides sp. SCSIO 12839]UTW48176.1 MATE family efflux transporter [Bacterioplanoides sp. SCSIO 12839]